MNKVIVSSLCGALASFGALNAAEPMATAEISVDEIACPRGQLGHLAGGGLMDVLLGGTH